MESSDIQVAVVTGAGRGIGRATALQLARAGFLVVGSSRTGEDLDRLVFDMRELGGDGRGVVADASDRSEARLPVQVAVEAYGRVDVLVNNTGGTVGFRGPAFDLPDEDFDATLALTLSSAWWATSAVLPIMRRQGYGRIVNIGSTAAKFASGPLAYTTAKHGLVGMTKALAVDAAPYGITVNCVCPGWTNTSRINFERRAASLGVLAADLRQEAESQSVQRRILEPEEVATAVAYIASREGGGMTGQIVSVDGGFRM